MAKPKKRGVKPGTVRGPYKKHSSSLSSIIIDIEHALGKLRTLNKRLNFIMKAGL